MPEPDKSREIIARRLDAERVQIDLLRTKLRAAEDTAAMYEGILAEIDAPAKPEPVDADARRADMLRMRSEGMTYEDIGRHFGISRQAVHQSIGPDTQETG
jgi:DNA-directed RNA polymerase specialized sigma24 family protein